MSATIAPPSPSSTDGEAREEPAEREVGLAILLVLALVVGVVAGLGAIVFKYLIAFISNLAFYGIFSFHMDPLAYGPPSAWGAGIILVPVLGGLIVVWLVRNFAPEAKGHGVPEVMFAIYHQQGNVRGVVAVVKSLASAISIGTGASVGREGPIIQIGASFGSTFARRLKLVRPQKITLLSAGAGAGIAATFNTPLGGVLFASEVLLPEVSTRTFLPVVVATATSTYVYRLVMGVESAFMVSVIGLPDQVVNGWELLLASLLGVVIGFAAWAFVKCLAFSEDVFEKSSLNPYLQNALGMGFVGLSGYMFFLATGHYQVMGVGYATIQDVISGGILSVALLLMLFAAKLLATCVSLGSGASGGVFSPSLFMGATLGGAIGVLGMMALPGSGLSVETFAIIGMGAMVGGATSAAMTAIVMIFEMTRDYEIILPLVLAVAIAIGTRRALIVSDIYTIKLRARGRPIPTDRTTNMFLVERASEVMATNVAVLQQDMLVTDALKVVEVDKTRVIVADGERITGFVRFGTVPYRPDRFASQTLAEIAQADFTIVSPTDNLNTVITRMNRRSRSTAIVVGATSGIPRARNIVGIIAREEIAQAVVQNHYG
ncbi:CBS domain-containing protein [Fulvimarina endophytica]|uniref:CBS domain-containing protein n=1 Tax=Fulvimarina endophytica TaxID=2293836 RepID=A0A371WZI5_9HYPH|nr:chloride channel protein [Fulvimarina endophytica]RFC62391.1 CBS domain-containing protein [Fulvimarina endophytica]